MFSLGENEFKNDLSPAVGVDKDALSVQVQTEKWIQETYFQLEFLSLCR